MTTKSPRDFPGGFSYSLKCDVVVFSVIVVRTAPVSVGMHNKTVACNLKCDILARFGGMPFKYKAAVNVIVPDDAPFV